MIRQIIKQKRISLGMSQADLAKIIGTSRKATISDFETGKTNLRIESLEKILKELNLEIIEK